MSLAALTGPGFTSLPECRRTLGDRLVLSRESFAGRIDLADARYTLILEDADGLIAGVAAVIAAVGGDHPHLSYRVDASDMTGAAPYHGALTPVAACQGWSEVGSLFLHPARRGGGAGALLSRARYLLIALAPDLFADTVMAELRGYFTDDGNCPFYDGVARDFSGMSFAQADALVSVQGHRWLAGHSAAQPFGTGHIPPCVRSSIGRVHPHGEAARAMLEREGFIWTGLVDRLDGGPTVVCPRDAIATVRDARAIPVGGAITAGALMARPDLRDFRVERAAADTTAHRMLLVA
ncbi:hypothetical protein ASE75_02930 [Sphingomonas sp. Leaf17]|uniref:arginine N-succinyltransferase n=1 Tax=Sphingomonas sp. Leaf17 TaxID=1735683 RepID=UPI0006FF0F6C|nr:arginine N-succinyltransferase [Sphingomonas sp. Leaf17]KQM67856.1 hypothetical protein ASE75_02930 [Sphingomonas sp. Leaf17]